MSFVNEENGITVFNGTGQKIEVLFQEDAPLVHRNSLAVLMLVQ